MPSSIRAGAVLCLTLAASTAHARDKVGKAVLTFYWTIDESSSTYDGKATATLRDQKGRVIAKTHPRFRRDLIRQGSGWLRDGRVLVYYGKVRGEVRFTLTKSKYGIGSNGCPLIPHRTVAVDPRWVKLGSKLYIPELEGAKLPDGTVHDGMFIASDRGQFRGAHIDLFAGEGPRGARPFIRKGYGSRSRVTVYVDGKSTNCRP